ncbi:DGCR6 (predicted) [Pycnogonum litorale]
MDKSEDNFMQKEYMQKKHYYLLTEVQNMAKDIPPKYQQRLPYELLSSLVNSLLDGTVYEIVSGLQEIQQVKEKQLFERRRKLLTKNRETRQELQRKHKDIMLTEYQLRPHNVARQRQIHEKEVEEQKKRQDEELARMEMKLVLELDQIVSEQQVMLNKAGVSGFYVTNAPAEIKIQMYLLEFIKRLGQMEIPSLF